MLKKIIVWIVVLAVALLAIAYFVRNYLIEAAVEEGSTATMGLQTDLGSAALSLGAGSLELEDYDIANPDGYEGGNIFSIGKGMLDVDAGSIFDSMFVVDSIVLERIHVNLMQKDTKGNYQVLFDNIRNANLGSESSGETRMKINKVALRDIQVTATLFALGEKRYEKKLTVDDFTLQNIGGSNGATVGEVAARIVRDVVQRAVVSGQSSYPDLFKGKVSDAIDQATESVKEEATKQLEDAGKSLLGGKK